MMEEGNTPDTSIVPKGAHTSLLWAAHLLVRAAGLERVRFESAPGLAFPTQEVREVREEGGQWVVSANVGGLDGTSGPLPPWMNVLLSREDPENAPVGDFLDIFNNRLIRLLYEAWIWQKPDLGFLTEGRDTISRILLCLLGIAGARKTGENGREARPRPSRLLAYIATLGHRPRSAWAVEGMLRDYFPGIPVTLSQFALRVIPLERKDQCALGGGKRLGMDMVIGERVRDVCGAFRVTLGPMSYDAYLGFLPGGAKHRELTNLVGYFVSDLLAWETVVVVEGPSIRTTSLGKPGEGPVLGQTAWLEAGTRKDERVLFRPARMSRSQQV
jgi:type VI secretion system protein ImpH